MLKSVRLLMVVGCLSALAAPASADPIQVTGFIDVSSYVLGGPRISALSLVGNGLEIRGSNNGDSSNAPKANCWEFHPCTVGDPALTERDLGASEVIGPAVIHGTSYTFARSLVHGVFTAEDVLIAHDATGVLQTPFTFTGTLSYLPIVPAGASGEIAVAGQGIMSIFLRRGQTAAGGLETSAVRFDFTDAAASPTPEPASLLLLASGAAFLYRRKRAVKSAA